MAMPKALEFKDIHSVPKFTNQSTIAKIVEKIKKIFVDFIPSSFWYIRT